MQQRSATPLELASEHLRRKMAGPHDMPAEMPAELAKDLKMLTRDRMQFGAGRQIVKAGERCSVLYLVESGWVVRSRSLAAGQRQIINYALAGDLLCADSLMFGATNFDLITRTPVSLLRIDAPAFPAAMAKYRGLAATLAWATAHEESILAERVVSLGRRDSLEKLAHALCELAERLAVIGRMTADTIEAPFNQEDFADLLGISVIHVNRTFRRLAAEKVAEYRKGRIELLDRERLRELAGFSPDYLRFN